MRGRDRSRYQGRVEPATFLDRMASYGARDAWDFTTNTYMRSGVIAPSGITFTRTSVGSYLNSNNTMTVFSSGQPRIGDKGMLIEGSRQNLFLNSAVGATQSITVTAAAHTLSFFGMGTVTLSGVSTDGPLVGTGEFDRVSLTFTPTAGSLTLTVSGDIKWVNLELGSFPSSWIPSDGTAVTRAADAATATQAQTASFSIFADGAFPAFVGNQKSASWVDSAGVLSNRIMLSRVTNDADLFVRSGGVTTYSRTASSKSGARIIKMAVTYDGADYRGAIDGTVTSVATAVAPVGLNELRFGYFDNTNTLFGYVRRVAISPTAFSIAILADITT